MGVNSKRLKETFVSLARIPSESLGESKLAGDLKKRLERMGAKVVEDKAGAKIGGNSGNIIGRFGSRGPFLMLNAHMDTVRPGVGVKPVVRGNTIRSGSDTVLGADCKSGIAVILETLQSMLDDGMKLDGVEVVLTVAEEIGLLGAKNIDRKLVRSKIGIALDSTRPEVAINGAPAANRLFIDIAGVESHAGIAPEKGVSAILVAAEALKSMKLGRIDFETTANIGKIDGGSASNIVPGMVRIEGEARSHKKSKLDRQTKHMIEAVKTAAKKSAKVVDGKTVRAQVEARVESDYPAMRLAKKSRVVAILNKAAKHVGMDLGMKLGGGGSDANIFNDMGIETIIIGTGMTDVHSKRESIKISDMVKSADLLRACVEIFLESRK